MPDQHRLFFADRTQLFLSTLDSSGQPWATLLEGQRGFVTSPTPARLAIAATLPAGDPAAEGLLDGAPIGCLGIEFETRRRNRANGTVRLGNKDFVIEVERSFGNCPRYIQARRPAGSFSVQDSGDAPGRALRTEALSHDDRHLIERSDTFFIASRSATPGAARSEGLDISHRGGRPGFVLADDGRNLRFPDYRGNSYFNTLGNLSVDPRCSILFLDFATGATLQIGGRGRVMNEPEAFRIWPGAERSVGIEVDTVVKTERRSKLRYEFLGFAPQFDGTNDALTRDDHTS
ncbi:MULTISPECIES: pyridoxamine 5'-phosphate oxidase family protein [unclassified Bradyrhizobium]|uniref:pyridoxamine 5'-phosphate oxidase family protein n=1 Tax=unclassified Bradyrhizobium TaxID=2631580 RepID=UPI00291661D9|nr:MULTISPECIES: pyridoxamine 5'-phosphate oxidase family protein [unclassified Bradyrhizobium]